MNRGESKGSNPRLGLQGILLYGFVHVFTVLTTRFYLLVDLRNGSMMTHEKGPSAFHQPSIPFQYSQQLPQPKASLEV